MSEVKILTSRQIAKSFSQLEAARNAVLIIAARILQDIAKDKAAMKAWHATLWSPRVSPATMAESLRFATNLEGGRITLGTMGVRINASGWGVELGFDCFVGNEEEIKAGLIKFWKDTARKRELEDSNRSYRAYKALYTRFSKPKGIDKVVMENAQKQEEAGKLNNPSLMTKITKKSKKVTNDQE